MSQEKLEDLDIYSLADKYYQKVGEVWDHETKDFKVLYKPLYTCGSKYGSFEAHHLAVSTFTRWKSKFKKVNIQLEASEVLKCHPYLVSQRSVDEIDSGNSFLPRISQPLPLAVANASPTVSVQVAASVTDKDGRICISESGHGTRSLLPYFAIDFDERWQDKILDGRKRATSRVLKHGVAGSEPHLDVLVTELQGAVGGVVAKAYSAPEKYSGGIGREFAKIRVTSVDAVRVGEITLELAQCEQFASVEEFKTCLKGYYPSLKEDDLLHVFHFVVCV